jgi:hypothetical protein
LQTTKREVP